MMSHPNSSNWDGSSSALLARQQLFDQVQQLIEIDGLAHADQVARLEVILHDASGREDGRNILETLHCLQPIVEFKSVHPGQMIVQDYQIWPVLLDNLQHMHAIGHEQSLMRCLFRDRAHK